MLDFYIGNEPDAGIYSDDGHIGGIEFEEWSYLSRFGFITSISYFDDKMFSHEEVLEMAERLNEKLIKCQQIPNFESPQMNKLNELLKIAISAKKGLTTVCDCA